MIDNRKEPISIEKRVGKFNIPTNIIRDPKEKEMLLTLFSKVIVIEATMRFYNRSIEYVAISEYFDEVEDGLEPIWYNIIIEDNNKIFFKNKENNKVIATVIKKDRIIDRLESIV